MKKRLNKYLAHAGVDSRRKVEDLILTRLVKVNDKVITDLAFQVDSENDIVKVNNKIVKEEQKLYFVLNKPKGFICSNTKKTRERLVIDIFKDYKEKLFTVGRLDRDTTGLIIVTNDGDLANKIIHPSANLEKEYIANVKEFVTPDHIELIKKGAFVEDKFVKPIKVINMAKNSIKIIVKEGKKREVKEFIKKAKLTLLNLQRVRIGKYKLTELPVGHYRKVFLKDLKKIF